ncbi:transmembrane protein 270 isoform X1 [Alligator sinensis]|uniref:Transmembrane protein 270 isoform X1 n=1 Tax=Alligator sinensis TaxID=38654 RepID=A0A3Q0HHP9_ALLSI|nr:transmembrane protein 270 isoform X1 [Alligator sinensis]XP_025071475.1 transmembrane protein 270 isoform X1 [Alligator sinensis]XP_025071476.1 transmembrane protein 270 isoform X1 [Alligator sinensis]XP_025071477.1 transmembrane protein 270 isoform X1 [Alligator sinensis]
MQTPGTCTLLPWPVSASTQAPDKVPEQGPVTSVASWLKVVVRDTLSPFSLSLPSRHVSLLSQYFCFWKVQWDMLHSIHLSLQLYTDMFFYWAQNLLLGYMLLLLLLWEFSKKAQKCVQRQMLLSLWALERQLITTQMLLKICYFHLKSLLDLVTWGPAYLIAWVTCLVSWCLQAAFEHTVRVAGVEEEKAALEVEQY